MKKFAISLLLLVSTSIFADVNREATGTVQIIAKKETIIVKLSGSNASCGNTYYFKTDTDYNRAMFSMLLAAQLGAKKVWVDGYGECLPNYPYMRSYKLVSLKIL